MGREQNSCLLVDNGHGQKFKKLLCNESTKCGGDKETFRKFFFCRLQCVCLLYRGKSIALSNLEDMIKNIQFQINRNFPVDFMWFMLYVT